MFILKNNEKHISTDFTARFPDTDDEVWSGGMGLVFLLHVQADVAIFVLVWLEDQRRKRAGADEESESE